MTVGFLLNLLFFLFFPFFFFFFSYYARLGTWYQDRLARCVFASDDGEGLVIMLFICLICLICRNSDSDFALLTCIIDVTLSPVFGGGGLVIVIYMLNLS
jgi:hypothetical protein